VDPHEAHKPVVSFTLPIITNCECKKVKRRRGSIKFKGELRENTREVVEVEDLSDEELAHDAIEDGNDLENSKDDGTKSYIYHYLPVFLPLHRVNDCLMEVEASEAISLEGGGSDNHARMEGISAYVPRVRRFLILFIQIDILSRE
jgi:hypothetical protein